MNTKEIADKLVTYCRETKWEAAQAELFSDNAVSIEPQDSPGFAKETKGRAAIIEKGRLFDTLIEQVHSLTVSPPLVAGDSFACTMGMDVTMKGRGRIQIFELCVYEVREGRIISEQFHK